MRATTISTSYSHGLTESVDKGRRVTDGCGKTNCSRRIGGEWNAAADEVLEILRDSEEYRSLLVMSRSAKLTLEQETDWSVSQVEALADEVLEQDNIGAGPASGSYRTEGMVIVPCSMKTAAGIVSGYTDNLLLRAADVTIKEKRPLVLAARETPMSEIHLRNLYELSRLSNVWIVPPMMTFYQKPESIDDMVTHLAAKLLLPFGVEVKEYRRWKGC